MYYFSLNFFCISIYIINTSEVASDTVTAGINDETNTTRTTDKTEDNTSVSPIGTNTISIFSDIKKSHIFVNNKSVPWNTFMDTLITVSTDQLDMIKSNIEDSYNLDDLQKESISDLFNNTEEYTIIVDSNLKRLIRNNQFNTTLNFALAFMNMSNRVLEKTVAFNLKKVANAFLAPTKWYKVTLKDKIQRQETKIAKNNIYSHVCRTLGICKNRKRYTDYLTEWLRYLISVVETLKEVFSAVPDIIKKYKRIIKSNLKFQQTIKYIYNSEAIVQKDTLEFVDEVITNKRNVVKLVPAALKKSAKNLVKLFAHINKNYNVKKNKESLENITDTIYRWSEGENIEFKDVLDSIVDNMKQNLNIWSHRQQTKVKDAWWRVIALE